jgi:hypothetical protein
VGCVRNQLIAHLMISNPGRRAIEINIINQATSVNQFGETMRKVALTTIRQIIRNIYILARNNEVAL